MLRNFLGIICITFLVSSNGFSRTAEGFYVTNCDDTIKCRFTLPERLDSIDFVAIQWKVAVYTLDSNKLVLLKPEDIKGYTFTCNRKIYTFISVLNNFKNWKLFRHKYIFLRSEINGSVKVYSYFSYSNTHYTPYNKYVIQKSNGALILINNRKFYKKIKEYFKDNKTIYDKIMSKEYKPNNILSIVNEYNK
jgi:hypothetical protein